MARFPIGPPIIVATDRLLAPRTITRGTFAVSTGAIGVFGGVRYDPARHRVLFFPNPGELRPGLDYVFTVHTEVTTWDGVALPRPVTVHFVPTVREAQPTVHPPSLARDVAPLFSARCARADCHGGAEPAMSLDLSSPAAIRNTTVGVLARERPTARADAIDTVDPRWGSLDRVDPGIADGQGRPEYSYLVYKLLGDGPMWGERMPREDVSLSPDEIALVADWIAAGAPDN